MDLFYNIRAICSYIYLHLYKCMYNICMLEYTVMKCNYMPWSSYNYRVLQYNRPFEVSHDADVAHSENEFDTPDVD